MPITILDNSITGIGVGGLPDVVNRGRLISVDRFTNDPGTNTASFAQMMNGGSFTWNKPSGCNRVYVICTGGGAGGSSNDSSYRGFAGGAGGTAIGFFDVTAISSVAVTTGSGTLGTRGADGNRPGTGGTSSFGSFCSATGGRGGNGSPGPWGGGQGGYGTGGNVLNVPGGGGDGHHASAWEGGGGKSFWHRTGGAHNNGTGQGDTDLDRMRMTGRYGSGGGTCYGSEFAGNDWRAGGAGIVVVYNYT